MSTYGGFAEGVSANLNGKEIGRNVLICRALHHLGHQVVYLNAAITFLVTSGLKNSTKCSARLKSDWIIFFERKVRKMYENLKIFVFCAIRCHIR